VPCSAGLLVSKCGGPVLKLKPFVPRTWLGINHIRFKYYHILELDPLLIGGGSRSRRSRNRRRRDDYNNKVQLQVLLKKGLSKVV